MDVWPSLCIKSTAPPPDIDVRRTRKPPPTPPQPLQSLVLSGHQDTEPLDIRTLKVTLQSATEMQAFNKPFGKNVFVVRLKGWAPFVRLRGAFFLIFFCVWIEVGRPQAWPPEVSSVRCLFTTLDFILVIVVCHLGVPFFTV